MVTFDHILSVVSTKLPAAGIDCLLIGGFAVNHYGYTRNTLDVDFMIQADHLNATRRIMVNAGFPNISAQDNVAFFHASDTEPRVDFLQVDAGTMQELMTNAVEVQIRGHHLNVPCLRDLLAMKIFALSQGTERRMGKDLPDISYLTVLNDLDLEADVRPLCDRFGSPEVFKLISDHVEGLTEA